MAKAKYRTPEFRAERKRIDAAQARGEWLWCVQAECVMGSRDIAPDQAADVAHDDSGTVVLGSAHQKCNRADGGRLRHRHAPPLTRYTGPRGNLAKRECCVCGTVYTPTYSRQATCGRVCGGLLVRQRIVPAIIPAQITKQCASCGVHFPHDGTARIYCENCPRPKHQRTYTPRVSELTCELCGAEFEQRGKGGRRKYCPTCSPTGSYYQRGVRRRTL